MKDTANSPSWMTRTAVRAATAPLPGGLQRDRYRQELTAEAGSLPRRAQLGFALSLALHSFALRRALARSAPILTADQPPPRHKPLLCRLHVRHVWHMQVTEDGQRYRRCVRCGLDDAGLVRHPFPDHGEMAGAFFFGPR